MKSPSERTNRSPRHVKTIDFIWPRLLPLWSKNIRTKISLGRKGLSNLLTQVTSHHRGKARQELKAKLWRQKLNRDHGETQLVLHDLSLPRAGTAQSRLGPPVSINPENGPRDLPTGQCDGSIFHEFPSSPMTPVGINLTKNLLANHHCNKIPETSD